MANYFDNYSPIFQIPSSGELHTQNGKSASNDDDRDLEHSADHNICRLLVRLDQDI